MIWARGHSTPRAIDGTGRRTVEYWPLRLRLPAQSNMSSPSPQLPIGQVIGSRYRIESLLGRGGMGVVYAATHELTERRVALKLMVADAEDWPVLQERFLSEARIAAAVRHPNIVDVLDMGLHEGAPFLVLELLEGVSLEKLLEAQQRLSVEQALAWLFPILGALATLHDAGIVHRDLKPSNIFLSSLPRHPLRPKLLDFGLARAVSDLRLTRSGTVIGTPLYMAPEHAAGQATGPQADVWSLGVVLYECLAGASPFNYSDRSSLAAQVLAGAARPLAQLRPDLPEALTAAIGRALQPDLGRRYPDMRSFGRALYAGARAGGFAPPRDPDPIGLPEYVSWQDGPSLATTQDGLTRGTAGDSLTSSVLASLRPRQRGLWWGAALALALALAAYGFFGGSRTAPRASRAAFTTPAPDRPRPQREPSAPATRSPALGSHGADARTPLAAPLAPAAGSRVERRSLPPSERPAADPTNTARKGDGERGAANRPRARAAAVARPAAARSPATPSPRNDRVREEVETEWK